MNEYSYVNADGDQITVTQRPDRTVVTACSNGTTTVHDPDGGSRSVNDPLGGVPVVVTKKPDGTQTIEFPNDKTVTLDPDGTMTTETADGTKIEVGTDGTVILQSPGGQSTSGLTLDEATKLGHIQDVQIISTGENTGTVAILQATTDGAIPFVYVPASALVPANSEIHQTLATSPTTMDTSAPGLIESPLDGVCAREPEKPPAPSGDTGGALQPTPVDDQSPYIEDIVDGAIANGVIPADLVGNRENTANTLNQVTHWLHSGESPQAVTAFLLRRMPTDVSDTKRQETAQDIVDWGQRLVDKTNNVTKQIQETAPDVPPTFSTAADAIDTGVPHEAVASDTAAGATPISVQDKKDELHEPKEAMNTQEFRDFLDALILQYTEEIKKINNELKDGVKTPAQKGRQMRRTLLAATIEKLKAAREATGSRDKPGNDAKVIADKALADLSVVEMGADLVAFAADLLGYTDLPMPGVATVLKGLKALFKKSKKVVAALEAAEKANDAYEKAKEIKDKVEKAKKLSELKAKAEEEMKKIGGALREEGK